jgi:hypothetical protein
LTGDEKHFTFFDAASPTYMVVNSEVAEGDLGEALPNFVKNLSALFAAALFIGGVGLFWGSQLVNHLLFRSSDY